jgi:hypothetical protein
VALAEELLQLEEAFWRAAGSRERYEENLAADAVHVFPGWGVTERERAVSSAADAPPWDDFSIDDPQLVELSDEVAALVYTARAVRGENPYVAAMTSVYRREAGGWQLVLHQQTPLPADS